jgi:hypothetical protein
MIRTSNIGNFVLIFALISQFIPAYFLYQYDFFIILMLAFVVLYSVKSVNKSSDLFLILLIYTFLVFCIIVFRELNSTVQGGMVSKQFLSDLRPLMLLLFTALFLESFSITVTRVKFYYLSLILMLTLSIPNIFGLIDFEIYKKIHFILYSDIYYVPSHLETLGQHMTVSSYASLNGRLSSIFLQPATAGIFFTTMAYFFIIQAKFLRKGKGLMYLLVLLSVFNGYLSGSTVIMLFPVFLLFSIFNFSFRAVILIFLISFIFIFAIYKLSYDYFLIIDDLFLGKRFDPNGGIVQAWSSININIVEFFIGINKFELGVASSKGFGDSGYLIKFTNGGILYILVYYSSLIILIRRIFIKYVKQVECFKVRLLSKYFNSLLLLYLMAEIGFTAFSQPQSSMVITIYLIYLYYFYISDAMLNTAQP